MPVSVVIVDDEPMVIESIRWGVDFEALHAEVCAAFTDSREALEYIRENPVDIVITDIHMPLLTHTGAGQRHAVNHYKRLCRFFLCTEMYCVWSLGVLPEAHRL